MATFYDREDSGEIWFKKDELDMQLTQDNIMANLHRRESYKDRVAVEDPGDQQWWFWFRADHDPDQFDRMVAIAWEVGTVLVRDTAIEQVNLVFDNSHQMTDSDLNQLLEGDSGVV